MVICDQCPICGNPIGPYKLKPNNPGASSFTKFQVQAGHKCFGGMPTAQFTGSGPCIVTLNQTVVDADGNKSKVGHTVTLRRYQATQPTYAAGTADEASAAGGPDA